MVREKVLITSALPYANGPLHFGHIVGAYLPADVFARFKRLQGADVLYLCGSDEYGIAITLSAQMAKRTPKEHVDVFHAVLQELFSKLQISFDHYSRTTWEGHDSTVRQFFLDLYHNGHIEEKITPQLFSPEENRFLADRYVVGTCPKCGFDKARGDECQSCGASYEAIDLLHPKSKISGSDLMLKDTKHWFLRFDHFKDRLSHWLKEKKWKTNVLNFALPYIQDLHERAITRDSDWGVPVPLEGAEGKVLYVWFDAPIGYISAAKDWALRQGDPDLWKKYWLDEHTRFVQFVGKDNIPFHAIFFPAMTMGQNTPYKLVDELPANEFYHLEGRQFSKSDGWMIDLERFFTLFSVDQARYALAASAPETGDADFSWTEFQARCNGELLGKYGNFVNRSLVFIVEKMGGIVPPLEELDEEDRVFVLECQRIVEESARAYDQFHVRRACQLIMELAQKGNVYFDSKKPWKLIKDPSRQKALHTTMRLTLECVKLLGLISAPIIPNSAEKIWRFLGFACPMTNWDCVASTPLQEGTVLPKPEILFPRVEDEVIKIQIDALKSLERDSKKQYLPLKEPISIEDVKKLDLRIAQILSAEPVPKSKKLVKLCVDIGLETRTVVAGIAESFTDPACLIGKKIILVANLKPATFMGIESQGMILAAKWDMGLELPLFAQALSGNQVS